MPDAGLVMLVLQMQERGNTTHPVKSIMKWNDGGAL